MCEKDQEKVRKGQSVTQTTEPDKNSQYGCKNNSPMQEKLDHKKQSAMQDRRMFKHQVCK